MENKKVSFKDLNSIDLNELKKKKGKFDYLSWAWAWNETKKLDPEATYRVIDNEKGLPFHFDPSLPNLGAFVKVEVVFAGLAQTITHPILNNFNKAIPVEKLTSFEVNTSIQRALAKCCALHGLGLYIFAGEDLPEGAEETPAPPQQARFTSKMTLEEKTGRKIEPTEKTKEVLQGPATERQIQHILEKCQKRNIPVSPEQLAKIKGLTFEKASSMKTVLEAIGVQQ